MPAPSVLGWFGERERQRGILEDAARLFDSDALSVHVGATFPLEEAAAAHRALEAGQVLGKAGLVVRPERPDPLALLAEPGRWATAGAQLPFSTW